MKTTENKLITVFCIIGICWCIFRTKFGDCVSVQSSDNNTSLLAIVITILPPQRAKQMSYFKITPFKDTVRSFNAEKL